jgi:hypothetical protein
MRGLTCGRFLCIALVVASAVGCPSVAGLTGGGNGPADGGQESSTSPDASSGPWCLTQPTTTLFCMDFEEESLTSAYHLGYPVTIDGPTLVAGGTMALVADGGLPQPAYATATVSDAGSSTAIFKTPLPVPAGLTTGVLQFEAQLLDVVGAGEVGLGHIEFTQGAATLFADLTVDGGSEGSLRLSTDSGVASMVAHVVLPALGTWNTVELHMTLSPPGAQVFINGTLVASVVGSDAGSFPNGGTMAYNFGLLAAPGASAPARVNFAEVTFNAH